MIIRRPDFDFSRTEARWAPLMEFAQTLNANSILFPPLERFLNRVMATARTRLTSDDARDIAVRDDIAQFIQQEGIHYSVHTAFNRVLERAGFTALPALEEAMDEDYRRLLKTKSLRFLRAYCNGFEALGPTFARIYLDEIEDYFKQGDPEVVAMWKWHLLEEYEHRTVCFDVYERLYGGYFYRIYGLIYANIHMSRFIRKVRAHIFEREWATMTKAERRASRARLNAVQRRIARLALPRLIGLLSPFYSPAAPIEPNNLASFARELGQRLS